MRNYFELLQLNAASLQLFKFSVVGTIGFIVDTSVLYGLVFLLGSGLYTGRLFSFLAAATVTWLLNRKYTFPNSSRGAAHHQWLKFLVVNAVGGAVNYSVYAVLISTGQPFIAMPVLAVAVGSLAGLFFNFIGSRLLVFSTS